MECTSIAEPGIFYRQNGPAVTSDYADGEVVVLNLETGAYYGLDSTAATMWMLLLSGSDTATVVRTLLGESFATNLEDLKGIAGFLDELVVENLLVASDKPVNAMPDVLFHLPEASAFTPPVLNKYTDMNELLLIDPVHEVDDRGWPNT